ncbi:MAG: YciI family protein [Prosthecobacter sp.]|nr:YciI family protein [Prosthecobacter sp.]
MNTPATPTSEYMVLFRSTGWDQNLSPEEMQKIMSQTMAWFERLQRQGKMKAAQPLFEEGKVVSGRKGRTVADGPFAESKETIGGYLLLTVDTLEEAVAIAQEWPLLECGCTLEVRPVAPECPTFKRIKEEMTLTAA